MNCKYCSKSIGIGVGIEINKGAADGNYPQIAIIHQTETDTPGIVLIKNNMANGYFEINYCPICGRKLTTEAATDGIIKEGDRARVFPAYRFECCDCGCIFKREARECRQLSIIGGSVALIAKCPTCNNDVEVVTREPT